MAADKNYLTSREVAGLLRIKPQTLYAYVSRGWIRSIGKDKRRGFLYAREDVERLRARGHARAEGGLFKRGTPRWSEPIVQSAITRITAEGPEYRGHPALDLARAHRRFENVAELLWSGTWSEEPLAWRPGAPSMPPEVLQRILVAAGADLANPDPVRHFSALALSMAVRGEGSDDLKDGNTVLAARALLGVMPSCLGLLARARQCAVPLAGAPVAEGILSSAGVATSPEAQQSVNAALVLLADHELTPQTFAARLAASSGASLYYCVLSALAVHSGSRIRRACDRVEDLLLSASGGRGAREDGDELARAIGAVPGFHHPLYPAGDPRGRYLVDLARGHAARTRAGALPEEATRAFGERPSVEAGLVALCSALRLPYRSAGAILAIARCAGWMAHVIEQRLAGVMLRPRARYLG